MQIEETARPNTRLGAISEGQPTAIWLTGLPGSGKTTIAFSLQRLLRDKHLPCYVLDGDELRRGINSDLGYTDKDRLENTRRIAEIARILLDVGLTVVVSTISPLKANRQLAKDVIGLDRTIEVFVDTPLDECIRRDPKGLYAKAMRGEINNLTGVGSPYEIPENPDLHFQTVGQHPQSLAINIFQRLNPVQNSK